jgi:hypothetical protein
MNIVSSPARLLLILFDPAVKDSDDSFGAGRDVVIVRDDDQCFTLIVQIVENL